ncbi:hypothetical protein OY671_012205, partial [Metschnikowia pulcherrima]
ALPRAHRDRHRACGDRRYRPGRAARRARPSATGRTAPAWQRHARRLPPRAHVHGYRHRNRQHHRHRGSRRPPRDGISRDGPGEDRDRCLDCSFGRVPDRGGQGRRGRRSVVRGGRLGRNRVPHRARAMAGRPADQPGTRAEAGR